MALIRANSGSSGGGGGLDYEVIPTTIPSGGSSITVSLSKGKMPQAVFIDRGWFYSTFDSSGNIDIEHIYYPTANYQRSNLSLSTTSLTWSGFDTSGAARNIKIYVIY